MATPTVKPEHMLQGSSNFAAWKARILNTFMEFDLDDLVTRNLQEPTAVTARAAYRKKQAKASIAIEEKVEEGQPLKRVTRSATREEKKECFLVSSLSGTIIDTEHIWVIDSGASKHMSGFKDSISNVRKKRFRTKVELGDNGTYAIEGIGSTSLKLESNWSLHLEEVLYVPGLEKNLLSVGVLEDKGYIVAFTKGKAIMWPSGGDVSSTIEIGVKEGNVYRLTGNLIQAQVHIVMNPHEL